MKITWHKPKSALLNKKMFLNPTVNKDTLVNSSLNAKKQSAHLHSVKTNMQSQDFQRDRSVTLHFRYVILSMRFIVILTQ